MQWLQYEDFPDTPTQAPAAGQQVGTRAEASGSSSAAQGQRTRLFGSVMDRLRIKSPNDTGAHSTQALQHPVSLPLEAILTQLLLCFTLWFTPVFLVPLICIPTSAKCSSVVLFGASRIQGGLWHMKGVMYQLSGWHRCDTPIRQSIEVLWLRCLG